MTDGAWLYLLRCLTEHYVGTAVGSRSRSPRQCRSFPGLLHLATVEWIFFAWSIELRID